jgi:hypothetical protein
LLYCVECGELGFAVERAAHELLRSARISGDWFSVTPDTAIAAVKATVIGMVGRLDLPRQQGMERPFHMKVSDKWLEALDDIRRTEPDLPTRAQMLHRLVERAVVMARRSPALTT